jgi:intein/homing endonuclease
MLYKDHANNKSNQKNIGTIKSSNLCLIGDTNLIVKIGGEEKVISLLDAVEFHQNGEEIEVLSYDIENGVDEYEKVLGASRTSKNSEIIEILDEESGKKIICTPEHLVYTKNRGYVEAKDLLETDILQIK